MKIEYTGRFLVMKKSMAILTFLLMLCCFVIGACRAVKTTDEVYMLFLEDVDYLYLSPAGKSDWGSKITISDSDKVEGKGIPVSLKGIKAEGEAYDIRFHSPHYYYIDFSGVELKDQDFLLLYPADDDHDMPYMMMKHDIGKSKDQKEEYITGSKVTYEY